MKDSSKWWKNAVIYQVYPRSFNDSNSDGIGDIRGIIEKLEYLKELDVDAIWLSPVYTSPNNDFGYDIADYKNINPEYGTIDDMKDLIKEASSLGIRIIMDLVINHTSNQHHWFKEAVANPESKYRNYYIWQNGAKNIFGKEKAPNNWTSFFTGPAWTKDEKSGQYYLHLFTKQQPDLNYRNPEVIEEVKQILNFWLDLGVAGFRCDVINILYKESFRNGKRQSAGTGREFFLSTPGTHKILKHLNKEVLRPRDAFTVGEATFATLQHAQEFTSGDELDTIFGFEHLQHGVSLQSRSKRLRDATIKWQSGLDWNTVFIENHDQPRSVSVLGNDKSYHYESSTMLATYTLTLRGTPFIYQGQEIGMTNYPFSSIEQAKDPVTKFIYNIARRSLLAKNLATKMAFSIGRDNARTPMQWTPSLNAGFSAAEPWMPVNPNHININVEQSSKEGTLSYYKDLIKLRKTEPALNSGEIKFLESDTKVLAFNRYSSGEIFTIILNMSSREVPAPVRLSGANIIMSNYSKPSHTDTLRPYESLIIKTTKLQ